MSSADVDAICAAVCGEGAKVDVVSLALGTMKSSEGRPIDVNKTFLTTSSVLYDAVVVPGGGATESLAQNADAVHFVRESFRHAKPIGATNEGIALLAAAALPGIELAGAKGGQRVVVSQGVVSVRSDDLSDFTTSYIEAIRQHRHFERDLDSVRA